MIVEKVTRKSRRYNEDRFLEFKSCFMVMDGATSLAPTKFKPSGGSFLVSYLIHYLKNYLNILMKNQKNIYQVQA